MKLKPIHILLVEDNPGDVELVFASFEGTELVNNLYVVEDGQEALDYVFKRGPYTETDRPDIVLLDINLPKIDGIKVLKQIKENSETKMIPVVILTSSEADKDIINSNANFASSYITKPVNVENFLDIAQSIELLWQPDVTLPSNENSDKNKLLK